MYIAFTQAGLANDLIGLNLINNLNYSIMKKALIFLLMLFMVQANAQTNPITGITISLPANPDANMANWGTGTSQLTITANGKAVNGRVDGFVAESKILVIIKKNGSKICGTYTNSTAPSSNFNTLTKVWSGSNAVSLIGQGCILPTGDYELSVQFFGYSNGKFNQLSEEKTKAFTIRGNEQQSFQAPQAIAPANETLFKESDIAKPITFRWTPVIPRPAEPVTYRLRVWQLMVGQNSTQARTVNQPIITKDVDNLTQATISNLITGPCKPPYLCDFVWSVQALNREGKPIGTNNGTSESFAFSFSSTDKKPPMIMLVSPANRSTLAVNEMPTFRWKITVNPVNDAPTVSLKIVEIIGDQSPEQAFRTNKPIFEKDSLNELSFQYPSTAPALKSGKKYAWAVGATTPFMFQIASCDINLSLKLKSVECLTDEGKNKRYKINLSSTYTSSTYNLTYTQIGSGLTAYHPSYSPNYSVTNISPPTLVSQNSGASSTVNYSFEVSVPMGQTAIKIGLQGDDKDPGPITCKPGAEIDIILPVCPPACECGEWGNFKIKGVVTTVAGANAYGCGRKIEWKCDQPFTFSNTFNCKGSDPKCAAKTTWTISKDGKIVKKGVGTNNISGSFTPNTSGTYTITLNAKCGDKECPPCTFDVVVDCKPVCDCGTWGALKIKSVVGPKGILPPPLSYNCGTKIEWRCNKVLSFNTTYKCNTTSADCKTKTSWEIKKDGVVIKSGNGLNNSADTFKPTENGTYILTLNANCGGKDCPPCTYAFIVTDCPPPLSCVTPPKDMVAWWTFDEKTGQPLVDRAGFANNGTGINSPLAVPAKVAGGLKFNGTNYVDVPNHAELNFGTGDFSFDAWIQTSDAKNLRDLVDKRTTKGYLIYLIDGKLGFLLRDGSTTNYSSSLFVADGKWHHIAITVERKNKKGILFYVDGIPTQFGDPTLKPGNIDNTSPLRIGKDLYSNSYNFNGILDEIELFNRVLTKAEVVSIFKADKAGKCKDVTLVCNCGEWGSLNVKTGVSNLSYDCGSRINWPCKQPFQFTSNYKCNTTDASCIAKTTWEVRKGKDLIKSGTGTNTLNDGFSLLANGTYTLSLNAKCGDKECKPCTYTIVVEDCKPPVDPCTLLLCNTDFEQFVNTNGPTTSAMINQKNIPCWNTTARDGRIEIWRSGFGSVPAYSGNYFAEVNATQLDTLYQSFSVTSATKITVSFAHRGRYAGYDKIEVAIVSPDGTATVIGISSANNTGWTFPNTTASYTIPSNALGIYKLQFRSISSNNGAGPKAGGNFLDAIKITCSEVPRRL